jgi:WD40 repeat protein
VALDRYGDPLPRGAIARLGPSRFRHDDGVPSLVFSPDGRKLVGCDGKVRVWEAAGGRELFHGPGCTCPPAFSPDGKLLATSDTKSVRILEAAGGKELRRLGDLSEELRSICFSEDGGRIVGVAKRQKLSWDVSTGRLLERSARPDADSVLAVSANREMVAARHANQRDIKLVERGSGRLVRVLRRQRADLPRWVKADWACCGPPCTGASDRQVSSKVPRTTAPREDVDPRYEVEAAAFSPDGALLAVGGGENLHGDGAYDIELWEVASGRLAGRLYGHTHRVFSLAFSPDGKTLASATFFDVLLWNVARRALKFPWHQGGISSLAFSPDGKLLATGGADHTIRLWEVPSGALRRELLGHRSPVHAVAFAPRGNLLASGSGWDRQLARPDNEIRLWDTTSGRALGTLRGHRAPVHRLAFSPDGATLFSASDAINGSNECLSLDFPEDAPLRSWTRWRGGFRSARTLTLAKDDRDIIDWILPSADGKRVLFAINELPKLFEWDPRTGRRRTLAEEGPVLLAPSAGTVAVWTDQGTEIRAGVGGKTRRVLGASYGSPLAFSPDGAKLVTRGEEALWLLDVGSGRPLGRFQKKVHAVAFSPDGKLLATGDGWLWDLSRIPAPTERR